MAYKTATMLHESVLVMKHTPSDIGRITDALFMADDRTLNELPRQAYQQYFDEIGIALLNWMGRGDTGALRQTLDGLTHSVFSQPAMKQLPELSIKQRIGLQLRVMCAQTTLYLKVQTAASYNARLTGVRNTVRRTVLRVLYEQGNEYNAFVPKSVDYQTVHERVLALLPPPKTVTRQNVHTQLYKLADMGLVLVEQSGGNVRFQISDRGVVEARFHLEEDTEEADPGEPEATTPTDGLKQPFAQTAGAILTLPMRERDYSMVEISRLIESNGAKIMGSYFTDSLSLPGANERSGVVLKLNRNEVTQVVSTLNRFGYAVTVEVGKPAAGEAVHTGDVVAAPQALVETASALLY